MRLQKLFQLSDLKLSFSDDAHISLADTTLDMELGARGLRGIIESKLLDLQYNISKLKKEGVTEIVINKQFLEENEQPVLVYSEETKAT